MAVECTLKNRGLRVEGAEVVGGFRGFERFLESGGPWVCGIDFPFGQPRPFVGALDWPSSWEGYVGKVSRLSREEFKDTIKGYVAGEPGPLAVLLKGHRKPESPRRPLLGSSMNEVPEPRVGPRSDNS